MEEPLLSPGFTSTVERPVEDLLVSVPRAPFSSPNPSSPIFAGRAHPKARRFDTHRPPPSQLIAKDASQRGATAAAEALRHAGELSDEEGYHQEERKKPSFGRLLVRVPNLEPEH
jgi:hypothetical protein